MAAIVILGGVGWKWITNYATRTPAGALSPNDLASALEDSARMLRSGSSLRGALVGSLGDRAVGPALAGGQPLESTLTRWAATAKSDTERTAAAALVIAAAAGGNQSRAVEVAAQSIRHRLSIEAEAAAHSAQARLSAWIVGLLPVAFLGWTLLVDNRTAHVLLHEPAGWVCLAGGLGLDAVGGLWLKILIGRVR